ncbi:response regulator [bacterium]|jgi:CheY-like chemotaxis protein|nr:response regulator [bacterium]
MNQPARLLVVEDQDDTRTLLVETLQEKGYEVFESSSGADVARLAAQQSFDLIITDILLPDKDGLEVILEIRKRDPKMRFLAISGGGQTLSAQDCLYSAQAFGAQMVLRKPFQNQTFLNAVETILS